MAFLDDFDKSFKPKDLIAIIVIVGYIFLTWRGITTMFSSASLLIIGYYFGAQHEIYRSNDAKS